MTLSTDTERRSVRRLRLGLVVSFIVCIGSIGLVIEESIKQTRLAIYGVNANATVVHIEFKQNGTPRITTLRFTTETGAVVQVKDVDGVWIAIKESDVIPIVYLPSDPKIVSKPGIEGFWVLFFAIAIAFFAGVFLLRLFR
jgi:hypothetical protein